MIEKDKLLKHINSRMSLANLHEKTSNGDKQTKIVVDAIRHEMSVLSEKLLNIKLEDLN